MAEHFNVGTTTPADEYGLAVATTSIFANTVLFEGAVSGIALNEIEDPTASKTFSLGATTLIWQLNNSASAYGWNVTGAFSGDGRHHPRKMPTHAL